jgi:hypothetical protein
VKANRKDDWKRAIFRSRPGMTDGCRVLLLRLLEDMNHKGIVSIPRSKLAAELGVAPARISERIALARDLGFLDVVRRARPKVTAVYQATIPKQSRGTESVPLPPIGEVRSPFPLRGTPAVPLKGGSEVQIPGTQVGNAPREPERTPTGRPRNVGNDEGLRDDPARYGLTVCDCHGFTDCVSLATAHTREETA